MVLVVEDSQLTRGAVEDEREGIGMSAHGRLDLAYLDIQLRANELGGGVWDKEVGA